MPSYSDTASTTVMGALFACPFVLETLNIFKRVDYFCPVGTTVVVVLLLYALSKMPRIWTSQDGVGIGAIIGFLTPFLIHLYVLFV
jgi:hypothetical protein